MAGELFPVTYSDKEEHWISIADVMAGLMLVFLFISIVFMLNTQDINKKIRSVAETYVTVQDDLYDALLLEFKDDLPEWRAVLDRPTLSVRFQEPDVLFGAGQATLRPRFQAILNDFFPRYISVLMRPIFKSEIEEIRIEGHTSTEWDTATSPLQAYFLNMGLSQGRTRSVLEYVLKLRSVADYFEWVKELTTANGLSSSKPILVNDFEDKDLSRRVEFRVRTKAERRIAEILETSKSK